MTELKRVDKLNIDNSLINQKNIFVPTTAVSADGKVINTKTNLSSQDIRKSIDDFEFYFPEYLNATTPDLSQLKSKVENNIFNDDILSSSNAFRLILMWLFTHVYPKMTELADNNLKLSSEGAVEALKNFTQLSLISLDGFKNAYEKEISAANCQLASSIIAVAGNSLELFFSVRNQYKNGGYEIDSKKLEMQKTFRDNIKKELTKYEAEGITRLNRYGNESEYTRVKAGVNTQIENSQYMVNGKPIFEDLKNISHGEVSALDNRGYLNHINSVNKDVVKVLNREEGLIDPKTNLFKEVDPNTLNDETLVRRTAILEKTLSQYKYSLNDNMGHMVRETMLNEYFLHKKRAFDIADLYNKAIGNTGQVVSAYSKRQGDFKAADSKLTAENNNVFMQVYNQEIQNKFSQIDGLKNVCKEAFDLLAKYLENYFSAANASNLQR